MKPQIASSGDPLSSNMWQGCEQEFASGTNPIELYAALRGRDVYLFEPEDNIPRANLRNGGICYIHSKLFEVSTPECRTPRELVAYDKASEAYARLASWALEGKTGLRSHLYKTSIAFNPKGDESYTTVGAHENYLVKRRSYLENLELLVPYLVARQIFCGSGGYMKGIYLISPRTVFPKSIYSSVSTDYPIVSTRDESHAGTSYSRAHIVNGEGARSELTTFLKLSITSYVLRAIELGLIKNVPEIQDPLITNRMISTNLDGDWELPLKSGGKIRATDLLNAYYVEGVEKAFAVDPPHSDDEGVLGEFKEVLTKLDEGRLESLDRSIEWIIKRALAERWSTSLEFESGLDAKSVKEAAMHQYSAVTDPLYEGLIESKGLKTVVSDEDIERAFYDPPKESRGLLRTRLAMRLKGRINSIGWSSLSLQPTIHYHPFEFNMLDGWTEEKIEEKTREIEKCIFEGKGS